MTHPLRMLLCLRKLRAMTAWSQRPDSLSIEFRERPTLEHLFQLEVRKSGALLGHVRRNAKGIDQYEPGPLDFHALDVSRAFAWAFAIGTGNRGGFTRNGSLGFIALQHAGLRV